jgi:hypothetical protein
MKIGGTACAARLTATSTSGFTMVLEITHHSYSAIEEAAFCIAAATDSAVTLDGVDITSEEAADELERMLDEQQSKSLPGQVAAGEYPLPPGNPVSPVPAYGPGYPVPPYPYGYGHPAASTNGLAVASLICAFFVSPLGLALGLVAKSQIRRTGEGGSGLATAGIVISSIFIVLTAAAWITIGVIVSGS